MLGSMALIGMLAGALGAPTQADDLSSLEGTWVMDSAFEVHADGSRRRGYGEHPNGLLIVDATGRYSLQIYKPGRLVFASGDKAQGSTDEYLDAVLGSSTHFGTVAVDPASHQLRFTIQGASFPNWEGRTQVRDYTYQDGLLSYAVPASASTSGVVAHSLWRRAAD